MEIKKATRTGVKPLIGLYGESGTGKTYSSLLMARGLVGSNGRILVCDTEAGRASQFADEIPGGYDVVEIRDDFSPMRYVEALKAGEKEGYGVVIFDSMSHEWEGLGGVLDWANKNEAAGKKGPQVWHDPKTAHNKMLLAITQSPLAIVCCMRAKYKTRFGQGANKKEVVKDDYTTPIQAEDFIFEMMCHFEILRDHKAIVTKSGPPSLGPLLPNDRPITIADGEAISKWCAAPTLRAPSSSSPDLESVKRVLWNSVPKQYKGETWKQLQQWLWDEGLMEPDETIGKCTAERLDAVTTKVQEKLKGN